MIRSFAAAFLIVLGVLVLNALIIEHEERAAELAARLELAS